MADSGTPTRNVLALKKLASNAMASLSYSGFEPLLLEDMKASPSPRAALDACDLLVVLGGADVIPQAYDEEMGDTTRCNADAIAENYEIALIQHAISSGMGVLGICRGMQLLNVACGGSLLQELGVGSGHYVPDDSTSFAEHSVKLCDTSRLASILGSREVRIRSAHHQAVNGLGRGLSVAARAPDGVVEAIELDANNLVIGVQWHPEDIHAEQSHLTAIFDAFASRAIGKLAESCV